MLHLQIFRLRRICDLTNPNYRNGESPPDPKLRFSGHQIVCGHSWIKGATTIPRLPAKRESRCLAAAASILVASSVFT